MAVGRRVVTGAWIAGLGLLCASGSAVVAVDEPPAGAAPGPQAVDGWTLAMREDFDHVDTSRWTLKDDTYSGNEDSFLRAANCSIERVGDDGHSLRLQAEKQSVVKWGQRWDYTSCYATTEGKYSLPDYFRAEVRAKVPMEQGMWAAPLWFRPADDSGGEIDLVETLGAEPSGPKVHQTIHTDYGSGHTQAATTLPFRRLDDPVGTGWHTYTIEKVPGRITMWADGTRSAEWSTGDPGWFTRYYDSGKRWDLRVNLQVGGTWAGSPDDSTDWSADRTAMFVDHVYVWTPTVLPVQP